jgi:SSS family solute:Na+ symporter
LSGVVRTRFARAMTSSLLLDVFVLLAYFGAIIGIGLAQRSKSDSVEGFTLGDRQIAWWAVLASILAAEISAATFLGAPESGFAKRNWTYAQFAIGTILARIIVSFLFIPLFYRHNVISLYEFLETRFGVVTRKFASVTFLITRVLAMGTRLYVSAIILVLAWEAFFGLPANPMVKFWLFAGAVVFVTGMTAIYTSVGGIRAVIWTDFIQVSVLVLALGFSIVFLLGKIPGGWATAQTYIQDPWFWNFAKPAEPGAWAWAKNVLTSEYTLWAAIIGSTFVTMATHGIDQDTVQRMLTAKNRHESAKATILSGLVDLPVVSAFILVGILLYAYYQIHPEPSLPAANGTIVGREVFPYFILHVMPAGMRGLVIAGILATAMGSLSTALNALATSYARDFALPKLERSGILVDEWQRVRVLRQSTLLFAGFIILVGVATAYYMAMHPDAAIIPLVLGILGFTFGSLLGVFLLGIFTRGRGNDLGNVIGMLAAVFTVIFFSSADLQKAVGFTTVNAQGETVAGLVLAFPWRITLGTFVTVAVAMLFRTPSDRLAARAAADVTNA